MKTILLDVGGTLVEMGEPERAYREILERRGYSAQGSRVREWLREAREEMGRPSGGGPGEGSTISGQQQDARRDRLVAAFLSRAGVRAGDLEACRKEIWQSWLDSPVFRLYPDTLSTLARLREMGFRLGVVSNWEVRLPELCRNLGIARFMDFFVVSEVEGFAKPGTELFRLALERAGVSPAEAIHVGNDLVEDIQPARALGIRAVLVRRDGEGAVPDYSPRLPSLEAVPSLAAARHWLQGRVRKGKGEAAGFTGLPWVREQFAALFGFEPFPGTLNIHLEGEQAVHWKKLSSRPGVVLEPEAGFCAAHCYRLSLEGRVEAVAVVPKVPDYPHHVLEVVAPVSLREGLCLEEGDSLTAAFPGRKE